MIRWSRRCQLFFKLFPTVRGRRIASQSDVTHCLWAVMEGFEVKTVEETLGEADLDRSLSRPR